MDIRISFFSYLINAAVCTAILAFLWLQSRKHVEGVGLWVTAFGLSLIAVALMGMREVLPQWLSILSGNLTMLTAIFLLYVGLERFLSRRSSQIHNIILLLAFTVTHTIFIYVNDNLSVRVINFSVTLMALSLQIAWLLLYRADPRIRRTSQRIGFIFLAAAGISLIRIGAELSAPSDNNLLNASTFQIVILLSYQVVVVLLAFGLALIVNRHLLIELREDIAQRMQVEDELRDSDARLTAILSAIPDLMFRMSRDGIHLDFYAPDPDRLFVSADDFIGKSLQEVLPADVSDAYEQHIAACLKSESAQTFEYSLEFADDDRRYYEARMVPLKTDEVLTIVREISDRKQAEKELAQHREHLEELVDQRTEELQAANLELMRLSRAKDEFVANVSHELRTPLTNLVLRQELIRHYPEKLDTYLNVMVRETRRLSQIIEDLLDLSRLDQKRQELALTQMDLNELVGNYVNDREELARQRDLLMVFANKAVEPITHIDESLMGQVLSILLTNAMTYTPAGGQITLSTQEDRAGDAHRVGFSVMDSGPGIPADEMPNLFERFFRGKAALDSGVAGTGLGLALARQIVEQHGGTIEVSSQMKPGEGACFTVWLPAAETGIHTPARS